LEVCCLRSGCLWHALELSNYPLVSRVAGRRYVVCYGNGTDPVHGVCQVDDKGQVKASYTDHRSAVDNPAYLAATNAGFVFVLDSGNKRVLLLDPDLCHVRDVISANHGLTDAHRLCWDDASSRLFVAEPTGKVQAFKLQP